MQCTVLCIARAELYIAISGFYLRFIEDCVAVIMLSIYAVVIRQEKRVCHECDTALYL